MPSLQVTEIFVLYRDAGANVNKTTESLYLFDMQITKVKIKGRNKRLAYKKKY